MLSLFAINKWVPRIGINPFAYSCDECFGALGVGVARTDFVEFAMVSFG